MVSSHTAQTHTEQLREIRGKWRLLRGVVALLTRPLRLGCRCSFRKNPQHLADYAHPVDDAAAAAAVTVAAPAKAATRATRAAPVGKPVLDKPTPLTPHTAAAAAEDAIEHPLPAAVAGKKRTRPSEATDAEPAEAAAAKPAAASAAAKPAAASGSGNSALPESAFDRVFELSDVELDASTVSLWERFHSGCWASSCPVHAAASDPASFFSLGAKLLRALYGMDFPLDLMHLLQFAVKAHHAQTGKTCCNVELKPDAMAVDDAEAASASNGDATAAASSDAAAAPASESGSCSWHACCDAIRSVFVPLAGVELAGPLRVLLGEFRSQPPQSVHPFLLDRGFYDSAEVWTFLAVVSGADAANFRHYAYYRDDPRAEFPPSFVGVLTALEPVVTPVGPHALSALMHAVEKAQEAAGGGTASGGKKQKVASGAAVAAEAGADGTVKPWTLDQLHSELTAYGKANGLFKPKKVAAKRDPAWLKREKKVVCDLDNGVGLVVPYEDDIGWRPVNCENEHLTKIVKAIEAEKYSGKTINYDALDHLVTLTAYSNDELDPGMGIELALNLFAKSQTNAINSDVCRLLDIGYQLVDRDVYRKVVNEHMRHRGKRGERPQHAWIKHG